MLTAVVMKDSMIVEVFYVEKTEMGVLLMWLIIIRYIRCVQSWNKSLEGSSGECRRDSVPTCVIAQ